MEFFEQIKRRPWNSHFYDTPACIPDWFARYPTMMSLEEMRMLAWIAQFNPKLGPSIDLGPFLGGSTVSLAHGLMAAGKENLIHSYDVFEIDEYHKHKFYYKRGYDYFAGTDTLNTFHFLTKYFRDLIVAHKGDVVLEKCPSEDPSIMFVDLSKSWELNDYILLEFFTKMKPGCVVVQQDYLLFQNPWLCHAMKKLESKIEFLAYTEDNSTIYGVREPVTHADVAPCLRVNTGNAEVVGAIMDAKKHFSNLRQLEMMDALLASFNARPEAKYAWDYSNPTSIPSTSLRGNSG